MNILPKKRWHVRTKENIARVRRDEAEAAEKEKERQRRILLAEQEARTDFLRKKAKDKSQFTNSDFDQTKPSTQKTVPTGHVNFFEELERGGGYSGGTNKEHEAEKKEEQEKYEKNIGLLSYLGQGSSEATGEKPWYLHNHQERIAPELEKEIGKDTKGHKNKELLDPLKDVHRYLKLSFGGKVSKKKQREERKSKKSKHSGSVKPGLDIEKLRAERLKREKEERERTRVLMAKLKGEEPRREKKIAVDERKNRYNCQFNPHLARQNQPDV